MTDLMRLMSKLVDDKGKLTIPGAYDHVAELTEAEKRTYDNIDFDKVLLFIKN